MVPQTLQTCRRFRGRARPGYSPNTKFASTIIATIAITSVRQSQSLTCKFRHDADKNVEYPPRKTKTHTHTHAHTFLHKYTHTCVCIYTHNYKTIVNYLYIYTYICMYNIYMWQGPLRFIWSRSCSSAESTGVGIL